MKITLKQLQLFVNVAKFGSISEGAKHSHITQSGASLALAELEKLLGFSLFDRHGKKVYLNQEGEKLLGKAATILDLAREIELHTKGPLASFEGHLTVGASSTIGNYLLSRYLSEFNQKFPKIKIDCKIANTQQIIHDVKQFRLDIAYIEGICEEATIEEKAWRNDELVIFARADHPLALKASLQLEELKNYSWVLRETFSGTRQVFEEMIRDYFTPRIAITLASSEALKRYVENSDCLSCLSKAIIASDVENGKLKILNVKNFVFQRPLHRILNKNKYQNQICRLFEDFIQAQIHNLD